MSAPRVLHIGRPVAQWVGEEDAVPNNRNSDTSKVVSPTTAAAPPPITTPTAASNTRSQLPATSPLPSDTGSGGPSNRSDAAGIAVSPTPKAEAAAELAVVASTSTVPPPPPPETTDDRSSVDDVSSPLPLPSESASEPALMALPTVSDGQAQVAPAMDPASVSAEVSSAMAELAALADGGDGKGGDKEETKISLVPPVADVPSRFKMAIGMLSGSARSTSAAKSSTASAAGTSAAASATGPGKDSSTSSSTGPSKFSSYAGRARNFLGKPWTVSHPCRGVFGIVGMPFIGWRRPNGPLFLLMVFVASCQ